MLREFERDNTFGNNPNDCSNPDRILSDLTDKVKVSKRVLVNTETKGRRRICEQLCDLQFCKNKLSVKTYHFFFL